MMTRLCLFATRPRRHRWRIFAFCALWPLLAGASPTTPPEPRGESRTVLRKCVAADGGIAYQSAPCAPPSRELWSREAERASPPVQVPLPKVAAGLAPRAWTGAAPVRSRIAGSSARQRCDAAKAEAARKRDRGWNRLTFDDLSRLDAWVAERCR